MALDRLAHPRVQLLFVGMIFSLALHLKLEAKNYGSQGQTFPILEENLLHQMQTAQSKLSYDQEALRHPQALNNLTTPPSAHNYQAHYFDPSYQAPEDIHDIEGNCIVKKGAIVNPLNDRNLTSSLLFFDGSNTAQVHWAEQQSVSAKWILVKGDPLSLEEDYERPVYFDQQGHYSRHFHIQSYPARITQEGLRLKIEEIPVEEGRGG